MRILLILSTSVLLATLPASAAERFIGSTYSVSVPDGWVQIPPYLVTRRLAETSGNQNVKFQFGFQLEANEKWFTYPYVIVQIIDYPPDKAPTEAEMKQIAQQLGDTASPPQIDLASHRFVTNIRQNVQGIGPVKGQISGHFGRTQAVNINTYARENDFDTYTAQFNQINNSFQWDRGEEYQEQQSSFNKLLGRVVGGAIVGIFVGVVRIIMKRRKAT